MCSDSNMKLCSKYKVPKKLTRKLKECNYEGRLTSDPDSVVNLVGCRNDTLDVSVMSSETNLTQNIYRQNPNGSVEVPEIGFSDELSEMEKKKDEPLGNDYALIDNQEDVENKYEVQFTDRKGNIVTMLRDENNRKCCTPVKLTCKKKESIEANLDCKVKKGKPCCGRKSKCSCEKLKKYILKQKRKKEIMEKKENPKSKQGKKKKKGKKGKRGKKKKNKKKKSKKKKKKSKKRKKKKNAGVKLLENLSKKDLASLMKTLQIQSKVKNPKCKPKRSAFRSKQRMPPIPLPICPECRTKEPVPQKKIYTHRTVEFGLFTDKHLYTQMAVRFQFI